MENKEYTDLRRAVTFRSVSKDDDGQEIKPTRRNFTLNSITWSDHYEMNGNTPLINNNDVPKLKLTEYQPIKKPDWSKIVEAAGSIGTIQGVSQVLDTVLNPINALSQYYGYQYLNSVAAEYSSNTSKADKLLDISDIENLMEGDIINSYEIPFFSDIYLRSNNKDNWTTGSAMESAGKMAEILNDGFQMNILKTPQWQNSSEEGLNWETEFYLYNATVKDLQKNFTFINSIFPSTQWVRMRSAKADEGFAKADSLLANNKLTAKAHDNGSFNGLQALGNSLAFAKSPNFFRVECPGRFLQLFVALDIEVAFVGNVRKMPLHDLIDDKVKMINENTLYPDAYKITISAKDMTPNCFNVYANYLMKHESVVVEGA